MVAHLASFAVGDGGQGSALAARALSTSQSERDAIRAVLAALPARSVDRRAESDLAPTSSDRALTIIGQWQPATRLTVGWYVLGGVARDDLDEWTGTSWASERVAASIADLATSLDLLGEPGTSAECERVAARLVDADHPEHGRAARIHALGCATCRDRIAAMQTTKRLVGEAMARFTPPADLPRIDATAAPERRLRWTNTARILALVALVVAVLIGFLSRPAPPTATSSGSMISADEVLDRAMTRFDAPHTSGLLHERYQVFTGVPLEIERYVDQEHHQLRVTVTTMSEHQPILDLVAVGTRLRYTVWANGDSKTSTIDNPRMPELQPLLRMLPEGGSMRAFPAIHDGTDIDLISRARRNGATLLGTTKVDGHAAYLLSYVETLAEQHIAPSSDAATIANRLPSYTIYDQPPQTRQMILVIDAATYALLRATNSGIGAHAQSNLLWQATTIEHLAAAPARTFDVGSDIAQDVLPDPRRLAYGPFTNIRLADVSSFYGQMPVPATVPRDTSLAYLREDNHVGIMQLYEGAYSTVALITAPPPLPSISLKRLRFHTGDTYWDFIYDDADVTHVEFIRNSDPTHRSRMYVWHATMSPDERRQFVESIIMSIKWVQSGQPSGLGQRFEGGADVARR